GSSTPAKVLFFQTSARSCWATVMRFIVMLLLLHLLCFTLALRKSPKPPRAYRTGIAVDASFADERAAVIARASVSRTLVRPHISSSRARVEHRRTRRGTRCDRRSLGRFGRGTCVPRWRCCWHRQGGLEPPRTFRSLPVAKGGIEPPTEQL